MLPINTQKSQNEILRSQKTSQWMQKTDLQFFEAVLSDAGVSLNLTSDFAHVLIKEQALVVRDLTTYWDNEQPARVLKFLKGLKSLCEKEKHFKKFLVSTQFKKHSENNSNYIVIHQESLFRLFLKVPCLQDDIIDTLLDGITAVSTEETQDTSWLRTLLNPLRCLPNIKNGQNLTTKLLDILEVSTFTCQLEILDAIPEILPDSECVQTAKQLSKLLDENDELSGAIIDCLNALNLESDIRAQVQDRILAKILAGTTLKIFPILLQFLMSDYKSQNLAPTLIKIRNALDTIMMSGRTSKERESCKILIFHHLQTFAVTQKPISETWLATISSIKAHSDHKPIDILILFMLHHTSEIRKRVIELIFRKRVSMGLFKVALLEKTFEKCMPQQLLKDYMSSIIEIGCCLLRSAKDPTVADFAISMFQILFNHTYTETIYRGEILSSLILLTGSNDSSIINCVLKLLSSLVLIHPKKVQIHMALLMQLFEKLDTLDLKNVKTVFDILCTLSCGQNADESLSGFKNEIHITIRKQLSSSERSVKHRGIISAIVMAKHMASVEASEDSEVSMEGSILISDLPEGPPKEAADLLELVKSCTGNCPELIGLYYDQLASVFASSQSFNKYFLFWLYDTVTNEFQSIFVTECVPEPINDMEFSMQYELNCSQDLDVPLGVNIVGLTICNKSDKILLLAPHFRLLRLLHARQHNEDLSSIDALLGCGVILPDIDEPRGLDSDQVTQVADCLFHCVNWFREIISGFVTQKEKILQQKVVRRLQDLIDVEEKLLLFLQCVPGHNLPLSYFDSLLNVSKQVTVKSENKGSKNPRKKIKSTSLVNEINDTTINTQKSSKPTTLSSKKAPVEYTIKFREMDTDIIRLMKYPLRLSEDGEIQFTQIAALNLNQVKFILKDFVTKLSVLTESKDIGLSHLNDVVPEYLIKDCVHILPHINGYFGELVRQIRKLLDKTDGKHDLPELFTDEAKDIKTCFSFVLQTFYLIFKWPGFQHSSKVELLRNLLRSMRPESSQSLNSANRLIVEFIRRLATYTKECLHLSHAVSLIKTMEILHSVTVPCEDMQKLIVTASGELLTKRWYNLNGNIDHGRECNNNIDVLVKAHLSVANIKQLNRIVGAVEEQTKSLKSKEDCLQSYASIDKQNFHVFYLGLYNALIRRIKTEVQALTNNEHLILWHNVAVTMLDLQTIVKAQQNRMNFACFLKKSIYILKIFLSHGIPILEIMLKSKLDEVLQILRIIQMNTRFLHNLCCESKSTLEASLVAHVPSFRHTLESLVYRVKAALVANDQSAAFWMGILRNRDLENKDIVSQSTVCSNEDEEENEQLPSDDEDDQNIINNENSNEGDTASKVFE